MLAGRQPGRLPRLLRTRGSATPLYRALERSAIHVGAQHPSREILAVERFLPARGLFTGICYSFGAFVAGQDELLHVPLREQLIAYQAHDPREAVMARLVPGVNGELSCHKVRNICSSKREGDYGRNSPRFGVPLTTPLHTDLDGACPGLPIPGHPY